MNEEGVIIACTEEQVNCVCTHCFFDNFMVNELTVVKNNTVMLWCNQIQRKVPDMEWEYRRIS